MKSKISGKVKEVEKMKNTVKIFLAMLFVGLGAMISNADAATTYYVRTDGGTASQCTGTVDAPYPGAGSSLPCAFNHPFWAISPIGNNPTKMAGGDTLIIDGSNGAQYKMGLGAPNTNDTSQCHSSWPWNCYMRSVPSGPSPTQPTRVLGKGWNTGCTNPPQLWGNEKLTTVLNLQGSNNVEVQCIDVTDHSACQLHGPVPCNNSSAPYGPWATNGLKASDSTNVLLKNLKIHGLYRGVHAGRLTDWTIEDTQIVNNSFVGWDGDIGSSSNSGTIAFINSKIEYNGCGETYPGLQPYKCYSQDQGGYGDGLGTASTGGNWVFNNVDFSHNVSDGLDLLYHNGNGTVTIKRSRFEGNAGNQVKTKTNTVIENSKIIGNCGYFANNPMTHNPGTFNNCRAGGDTIALSFHSGKNVKIRNSTIVSNGNVVVLSTGSSCNGSEFIEAKNNIFLGGTEWFDHQDKSALYYADGSGACGQIPFDHDYSVVYNTKNFSTDCVGSPHSICANPQIEESAEFYTGTNYDVNLKSGSPARNAALVIGGMSNFDFNLFDRESTWDIGSLEYGSLPGGGQAVCGNGVLEPPEQCDDGNTSSGDGCSSTCTIEAPPVCGNGIVEGNEQCDDGNLSNGDGCSSLCQIETPAVCGNGVVEGNEECDDGNTSSGDGCSSTCTLEQQQTNYSLMLSYSSNRSGAVQFPAQLNPVNMYAFISPTTGVSQVKFYLDDPERTGSPIQTEGIAEYDFAGTASSGSANPFNAGNLSSGAHTITAEVRRTNNTTQIINAPFTVASGGGGEYELMLSYSSNRSGAVPFPSQVNATNIYAFVSPVTGVSQVKFYLDDPQQNGTPIQIENLTPYDFKGTASSGNANPFNAASLSSGQHTITAVVKKTDNTTQVINVPFTRVAGPVTLEAENFSSKPIGGAISGGWNIWSNGYISNGVTLTPGNYRMDIVAKGQLAGSQLPNMRIRINGGVVSNTSVGATSWTTYSVNVTITQSSNNLEVGFTNDYYNPGKGQDRNLHVDKVTFVPL